MAVEKGQKYKGVHSGDTYEVLSNPFGFDGTDFVAFRVNNYKTVHTQLASCFLRGDMYTLIREPKFKVGDRVVFFDWAYEIVAVSSEVDYEGEFSYILKNNGNGHDFTYEPNLKAAE